jgi:hypothetical protein
MNVPTASQVAAPAAARTGRSASMGGHPLGPGAVPGLIVALLTAVGVAIRVVVAHQSLYADELSTYWIVTKHGLGSVISTVHGDAEITPPLYFVASWLTTQLGHTPEMVRLPSLLAGVASIPLIYLLGLRTVKRPAALVGSAFAALSPFMIYYSTEARGYMLMIALIALSTLAMLVAVETGRARWWVVYAASSVGAVYTHYTCVFALAAQLLWLWWAHPEARKAAIVANVGALVVFAPWTSGLANDLSSPTTKILAKLSPLDAENVRFSLGHLMIGYPEAIIGWRDVPGITALVLLALALLVAVGGLAVQIGHGRSTAWLDRRLLLVVALALSVPVGEAVVSAVGNSLWALRNLAASWPALALLLGALLTAAGSRLRFVASGLAIASFALGAHKMLEPQYRRPEYQAGARFVDSHAAPRDAVIDGTAGFSPGPLSPLDVALHRPHRVFRAGAPAERSHPFGVFDPIVPMRAAIGRAVAAAPRGRIFLIVPIPLRVGRVKTVIDARTRLARKPFPPRYHIVEARIYRGIFDTEVQVYARRGG